MRNISVHCDDDSLQTLSDLFRAYSDMTRLRIILSLIYGEKSVSDLCTAIDMEQSAVSHQLSTLKRMHIVKSRRNGKSVLYSLHDNHVLQIINQGLEHVSHILQEETEGEENNG